jgi:hypothetical protein
MSKSVHGGKKRTKTDQPSLNCYQGLKLNLIKSLRACLDQNRVEGLKLNYCKTCRTKNTLNPFFNTPSVLFYSTYRFLAFVSEYKVVA